MGSKASILRESFRSVDLISHLGGAKVYRGYIDPAEIDRYTFIQDIDLGVKMIVRDIGKPPHRYYVHGISGGGIP